MAGTLVGVPAALVSKGRGKGLGTSFMIVHDGKIKAGCITPERRAHDPCHILVMHSIYTDSARTRLAPIEPHAAQTVLTRAPCAPAPR